MNPGVVNHALAQKKPAAIALESEPSNHRVGSAGKLGKDRDHSMRQASPDKLGFRTRCSRLPLNSRTRNRTALPRFPQVQQQSVLHDARSWALMYANYGDAVKTKVVIWASLGLLAVLSLAEAGPRAGVFVRAGGAWCPPVRAVCPRFPVCPQVVCRSWPVYYYPSYYGCASSPVVSSTSFSNVSPGFFRWRNGHLPCSSADHFSRRPIIDSPGTTFRLAALISPAEVRPSLDSQTKEGRLCFRGRTNERSSHPSWSGERPLQAIPLSNFPVDKLPGNIELRTRCQCVVRRRHRW